MWRHGRVGAKADGHAQACADGQAQAYAQTAGADVRRRAGADVRANGLVQACTQTTWAGRRTDNMHKHADKQKAGIGKHACRHGLAGAKAEGIGMMAR